MRVFTVHWYNDCSVLATIVHYGKLSATEILDAWVIKNDFSEHREHYEIIGREVEEI